MRRFLDTVAEDWPRLLLELVVLVVGISASFALEQWREDRELEAIEYRAWEMAHDDLAADTLVLQKYARRLADQVRAAEALLGRPPAESLDVFMDRTISYASFRPAGNAYQELRQSASARQLRQRELFNALAALHNQEYERAHSWDDINERLVLERMVPYLEAHAPSSYAATLGGLQTTGLAPT